MGDRFYQQQYGVTMGALPEPRRKSITSTRSKADLVNAIGIDGIEKLLVVDLQKLQLANFYMELEMPTGRLKKPYIDQCLNIDSEVDWSKMTVAGLKNVINSSLLNA